MKSGVSFFVSDCGLLKFYKSMSVRLFKSLAKATKNSHDRTSQPFHDGRVAAYNLSAGFPAIFFLYKIAVVEIGCKYNRYL